MTHICVGKLTNIDSDNGLSPKRRQAIIWTKVGILLIGPLGTNFSEFNRNSYIFTQENTFENVVWEMAAILSRPQCVKEAWDCNHMIKAIYIERRLATLNEMETFKHLW